MKIVNHVNEVIESAKKEVIKFRYPLKTLQFFAEGDPPADPPTDPMPNDPPATDPPADPPVDDKTFSQEEVNRIAAKEAKKAQEAFLKKLGVKDFDSAKDGLAKLKEIQDSQKTEAEKQAERLKLLEGEKSTYLTENETLKANLSALKAGTKTDSIDDVVTLAKNLVNDETTMDAAIGKVLEKYPHFKEAKQNDPPIDPKQKPTFTNGEYKTDNNTEEEVWKSAFKW